MDKTKTRFTREELSDKIKGVIFGTAIGDGVGLATEFMNPNEARILYGNGPIKFGNSPGHEFWRDACRRAWFESDFTDDTDQMLLMLQSLLETDGSLDPINFAHRLREWCRIGFPELENKLPNGIGFTVGNTCFHKGFLEKPLHASYEIWNKNQRNLAANGALMRTGVAGVPYFWSERKVVENAMLGAKVTHTDPRSVLSAVISSVIISRLLKSEAVEASTPPSKTEEDGLESNLTEIMEYGSTDNHQYLDKFKGMIPDPKPICSSIYNHLVRQARRFSAYIKGESLHPLYEADFKIPKYENIDVKRLDEPVPLRPNIKSLDEYEADLDMVNLCKDVVDRYKFLLEQNSLCPNFQQNSDSIPEKEGQNEIVPETDTEEPCWVDQLYAHCFPESVSSLKLCERGKIGYTFKCLGAALYLGTRKKPDEMSNSDFFENLITQLCLQTGDSDTNCAAAGAILGCRLGKSGLPKGWVDGLRHHDFLEKISDELCEMVFTKMQSEDDNKIH